MQEITDRIDRLTACLARQAESYAALGSTAAEEQRLIRDHQMEALTPLLERKQELLQAVAQEQPVIDEQQRLLAAFFDLSEFTVPQVLKQAPDRYRPALQRLQETLQHLVTVLETVEAQEKELEAELRKRMGEASDAGSQPKQQAAEAYKKHKPKA